MAFDPEMMAGAVDQERRGKKLPPTFGKKRFGKKKAGGKAGKKGKGKFGKKGGKRPPFAGGEGAY